MAAGFSTFAGPQIDKLSPTELGDTVSHIVSGVGRTLTGGVASVLGGGKFANGAITSSFEYLFNELGHAFQALFPAHTAAFSVNPIGGSVEAQLDYANQVNELRSFETDMATIATFFGSPTVDAADSLFYGARETLAEAGSLKQWIRIGPSYSQYLGERTWGIRWGASPRYLSEIPSPYFQNLNQTLRQTRIPIDSWRTADPGHLHLWK